MPETVERPAAAAGYEEDFYLWTQAQAAALRRLASERVNEPVDWENVAEEIESVGRSDRRALESLLSVILIHLIKLKLSARPEPRNHWIGEIDAARDRLKRILADSPSLRGRLRDTFEREWPDALLRATAELRRYGETTPSAEPSASPWITAEQALDRDYVPDAAGFALRPPS